MTSMRTRVYPRPSCRLRPRPREPHPLKNCGDQGEGGDRNVRARVRAATNARASQRHTSELGWPDPSIVFRNPVGSDCRHTPIPWPRLLGRGLRTRRALPLAGPSARTSKSSRPLHPPRVPATAGQDQICLGRGNADGDEDRRNRTASLTNPARGLASQDSIEHLIA